MANKTQIRADGVEGFFRRAHETARKLDNKEPIASERIISIEDADEIHSEEELEQYTQELCADSEGDKVDPSQRLSGSSALSNLRMIMSFIT